ncbi:hypothetical protein ABIA31_005759 [Catenulispora sp. MAP5-51]
MNNTGPATASSFGDRVRHGDAHGTAVFASTRRISADSAPTEMKKYTTASNTYPMASTRL